MVAEAPDAGCRASRSARVVHGPGAAGEFPEPPLRDTERVAHVPLQGPELIEPGRFGVEPPPGLRTPPDDPGEGLPPGGLLLRCRDTVLVPHPYRERGGKLPLGLTQGPRERPDGIHPEPVLGEGEFLPAGTQTVIGLDEGGTGLPFQYGERGHGRLRRHHAGGRTGTRPTGTAQIPVPREDDDSAPAATSGRTRSAGEVLPAEWYPAWPSGWCSVS